MNRPEVMHHDWEDILNVYDAYDRAYEAQGGRLRKRYVRDARDPFNWWAEHEFKQRYRFSKNAVMHFLLPLIVLDLQTQSRRGLPIPPVRQLLLCLRFYATGSFQAVCGDLDSISQKSASNVVRRVSHLLASLHARFIKFPATQARKMENSNRFQALGRVGAVNGIPGIGGAIDCTHIKIVNTPRIVHAEVYRNRKGFFSLNVQAVAGPKMEFLDIVARWAGSTHDSRIFQASRLNVRFMEGNLTAALLGDAGYPSLRYLYTPLANPNTPEEERYNRAHIKMRNVVERAFGIWKRRFPCLRRGLGNALPTVSNIIVACAVLHNVALQHNDDMPDDADEEEAAEVPVAPVVAQPGEGFAVRQALINAHFAL